jgi:PadR family transcriptional regulator PadR
MLCITGGVEMKIDKSLLSGSTPLLVMSLLKDGDMYGYQMVSELARRSDNTFELKEGTLYPLLHTLEKAKYVKSYMQEAPSGRQRKYYRLTDEGRIQLANKTEEWRIFSQKVDAVLGTAPSLA